MASLFRTQGCHEGKWIYPVDGRCVLGRHKECDISDIFADNSNVSRFHALLERVGGRYYIEDKGSRNGTFLNGSRLTSREPLQNGDQLGIAGVELTFLEEAENFRESARANVSEVSFSEPAKPETPRSRLAMTAASAVGPFPGYSGDKLVREVQTFLGNQPQSDDMCLVGWGRLTGAVERTGEFADPAMSITKRLK